MIVMPTTQNFEAPPKKMAWQNAKVRAVHAYDGTPPKSWCVQDNAGSHSFPADEWEMSIEFKRKPKPLVVGERVKYYTLNGIIDAISETAGTRECWVRNESTGLHGTYLDYELTRVEGSDDN